MTCHHQKISRIFRWTNRDGKCVRTRFNFYGDTAIEVAERALFTETNHDLGEIQFKDSNVILVVEDNKVNQELMVNFFKELGLDIHLADNVKRS